MVTERDNIHVAVLFIFLSAMSWTGIDFATAAYLRLVHPTQDNIPSCFWAVMHVMVVAVSTPVDERSRHSFPGEILAPARHGAPISTTTSSSWHEMDGE